MRVLHGEIVELEKIDLEGGKLVCGFPGPGLVGSIAAKYLAGYLKMEEVAYLRSRLLPPISMFYEGRLQHPFRVHIKRARKLAVLIAETLVPSIAYYDVASSIVNWAESKGVYMIVCLEGVPASGERGERLAYGAAEDVDELEKRGIKPLNAGVVAGISGAIMNECLVRRVKGVCLFVQADASKPDVEAAAALLQALNSLLGLKVKTDILLANANQVVEKLQGIVEHLRTVKESEDKLRLALYA
ncbi:MAG: hypothetical protein DRJ98_04900 [Thermoprotei archaeon]|nr:MAG: hypothetical protein DRJ98_04900 [Thermoprotei archaeon]